MQKKVITILLPYSGRLPLEPAVSAEDRITRAIELMVEHDLSCMAVVRNGRPIGMVRLGDAFKALGLQFA